jgi:hypothetical protein
MFTLLLTLFPAVTIIVTVMPHIYTGLMFTLLHFLLCPVLAQSPSSACWLEGCSSRGTTRWGRHGRWVVERVVQPAHVKCDTMYDVLTRWTSNDLLLLNALQYFGALFLAVMFIAMGAMPQMAITMQHKR